MANEISLVAALMLVKSGIQIGASKSKVISQSGTGNQGSVQNIGTVSELIVLTDIDALGYVMLVNLDETNYVQVGLTNPVSDADAVFHLLPGEFAVFPTRQEAWYAKANTAAVNLQVIALEL
jgi:hypothetical protein